MGKDIGTKLATIALAFLGAIMVYRSQHGSTAFAADGMDMRWDSAAQRCKDSGRPTVVLFTADWCSHCQDLHENVLPRGDVQDELRHYNYYVFDLSNPSPQAQAHAHQLGVSGIPQLIRYDANGQETDRRYGMDAEQLIAWLKAGE
jgi:thioredoxin:protein disulfide reductase